jgi:AbrB family looped-hinge helix DNA binding protein
LALPGAEQKRHFDSIDVRVRNKVFASFPHPDQMTVRLEPVHARILTDPIPELTFHTPASGANGAGSASPPPASSRTHLPISCTTLGGESHTIDRSRLSRIDGLAKLDMYYHLLQGSTSADGEVPMLKYRSTVARKGQVTIPKEFRDELGLSEGDRVEWSREGDTIVLKPAVSVVERTAGMFKHLVDSNRPPITIEEMKEAAARGWVEGHLREETRD